MTMENCKYKPAVLTIAYLFVLFDLQMEVQKYMSHLLSSMRKVLVVMKLQVSLDQSKFICNSSYIIILSLHSFVGTKKTHIYIYIYIV